MTIAALFVEENGVYSGLPDVEVWGISRDARGYRGPHRAVCHSPCARWSQLAKVVEARWGHKRGDDGGCFKSALHSVRTYGGVLEHPAFTEAWAAFLLPEPPVSGGWVRGICGGWACHVEQGHYGHLARKGTWLYAFGVPLPVLKWGPSPSGFVVGRWKGANKPEMPKRLRHVTPLAFRDVLLDMARGR